MPSTVTHVRVEPSTTAADTTHRAAVYLDKLEAGPYVTEIRASLEPAGLSRAGPKSNPSMNTTWPPSVLALWPPGPYTLRGEGGRKEVVWVDGWLA